MLSHRILALCDTPGRFASLRLLAAAGVAGILAATACAIPRPGNTPAEPAELSPVATRTTVATPDTQLVFLDADLPANLSAGSWSLGSTAQTTAPIPARDSAEQRPAPRRQQRPLGGATPSLAFVIDSASFTAMGGNLTLVRPLFENANSLAVEFEIANGDSLDADLPSSPSRWRGEARMGSSVQDERGVKVQLRTSLRAPDSDTLAVGRMAVSSGVLVGVMMNQILTPMAVPLQEAIGEIHLVPDSGFQLLPLTGHRIRVQSGHSE